MKATAISVVPPVAAEDNPGATPELLAATLAKYSRSDKGVEAILDSVDRTDPDKAVESVFKFLDYGHASVGGLTSGIPVALDGISMYLAYRIFEFAQQCDGQESSTRYLKLTKESLPDAEAMGIPFKLQARWRIIMAGAFDLYQEVYDELDTKAKANPEIVRVPAGASEKVADRLRKNYALDRARYFIPFATKTNAAYVMTARAWAETLKSIDSLNESGSCPEAASCAALIRRELAKYVPRLLKHSYPDDASGEQACARSARDRVTTRINSLTRGGGCPQNIKDEVFVQVQQEAASFLHPLKVSGWDFLGKTSRYSEAGLELKRTLVRFAWNNVSIAELRDHNRHRTGFRFATLAPAGFYLPPEVDRTPRIEAFLRVRDMLLEDLAATPGAHYYGLLLGDQVAFEHSTHADKFVYEVELRTGLGAHFRYAEHLTAACREFVKLVPGAEPFIQIGTAEPE